MNIVVLGNSKSGKDTVANALETVDYTNLKFSHFAKSWLDKIYGGIYSEDGRDRIINDGTKSTKLDIMISLYHLFQDHDPQASVNFAKNNFPTEGKFVFTDVRTQHEMAFVLANYNPRVIVLPKGVKLTTDTQLEQNISTATILGVVTHWTSLHPATFTNEEILEILNRDHAII